MADPLNNNWNKYCWLQFNDNGTFSGYAYSTTFAGNGYGTTDMAGAPATSQNGFRVYCNGTPDCPGGITPVSGTVTGYTPPANNLAFNTACVVPTTGTGTGIGP